MDRRIATLIVSGLASTTQASAQQAATGAAAGQFDDNAAEIVVTGTRGTGRSLVQSTVPVDAISSRTLEGVVSSDIDEKLAETVPSFSVQTKPLYGAISFVRPAGLRGLNPDETLVLVNGKREHRSAFINFNILGGGAQGVDLSQISASALKRIEVLRDGASAQYGSDAIAGVINLILKDEAGYEGFAQRSRYYAGDGNGLQVGLTGGWRLGDRGGLAATFQYDDAGSTSRSLQRVEAANLIAAGNTNVRQPAVTTWGQPALTTYRASVNGHYDLFDSVTLYGFVLYGYSDGYGNLNWRSPNSSALARSIYQNAPYHIFPNYSAVFRFPGGFTPFLGVDGIDVSAVVGVKGNLTSSLTYDLSGDFGSNIIRYHSWNTLNSSLGPQSPTSFDDGGARQQEWSVNADFVQSIDLGLPQPLAVAVGAEVRRETFAARPGEYASWAVGPLSDLPSGAGGQVGILPDAVGEWSRQNISGYIDIAADLTRRLTVDVAGRIEGYSDFGRTVNGKVSGRYELARWLAVRAAVSSGFRAPTPGQSNSTITQQSPDPTRPGQIFTLSLVPPTSAIARSFGATPLKPERSLNLSGGLVIQPVTGLTATIDGYYIRIADRLAISQYFEPVVGQQYMFLVNGYTTGTAGADAVLSYVTRLGRDTTLATSTAWNFNRTSVLSAQTGVIGDAQRIALARRLPTVTGNAGANLTRGRLEIDGRARFYGSTIDLFFDSAAYQQRIGNVTFFDLSVSYRLTPQIRLTLGGENIFDHYPDRVNWGGPLSATNYLDFGRKYPSALPYSSDGGRYYARVSVRL